MRKVETYIFIIEYFEPFFSFAPQNLIFIFLEISLKFICRVSFFKKKNDIF